MTNMVLLLPKKEIKRTMLGEDPRSHVARDVLQTNIQLKDANRVRSKDEFAFRGDIRVSHLLSVCDKTNRRGAEGG